MVDELTPFNKDWAHDSGTAERIKEILKFLPGVDFDRPLSEEFTRRRELCAHTASNTNYKSIPDDPIHTCHKCLSNFSNPAEHLAHTKECDVETFQCKHCREGPFSTTKELGAHWRNTCSWAKAIQDFDMCFVFSVERLAKAPSKMKVKEDLYKGFIYEPIDETMQQLQEGGTVKHEYSDIPWSAYGIEDPLKYQGEDLAEISFFVLRAFLHVLETVFECDTEKTLSSDKTELLIKARLTEIKAKQLATRFQYVLQFDRRVAQGVLGLDDAQVPPYAPYQWKAESDSVAGAVTRKERRVYARYDRLSQVVTSNYSRADPEISMFRQVDRARLLEMGLSEFFNVKSLQRNGLFGSYFLLHQPLIKQEFHDWSSLKQIYRNGILHAFNFRTVHYFKQRLDQIRDYYGESIALYFAYIELYTQLMTIPGLFGLLVFLCQLLFDKELTFGVVWLNYLTGLYAGVISMWTVYMARLWERRESYLSVRWGMVPASGSPGIMRENSDFIFNSKQRDSVDCRRIIRVYSKKKLRVRRAVAIVGSLLWCVFCCFAVNADIHDAILNFLQVNSDLTGGYLAGFFKVETIVTAALVLLFDFVFKAVAGSIVNFENYRYTYQWNDAYALKVFGFAVIDYFSSFLYIGFYKAFTDTTENQMTALRSLLATQLGLAFAFNFTELGWPLWAFRHKARGKDLTKIDSAEQDTWREEYPSTIDDYIELMTQLGLVSFFSILFPAAPLVAWMSNHAEVRVDAHKLTRLSRRPFPEEAKDIGAWKVILKYLGMVNLLLNIALIVFVTVFRHADLRTKLETAAILTLSGFAIREFIGYLVEAKAGSETNMRKKMVVMEQQAVWGKVWDPRSVVNAITSPELDLEAHGNRGHRGMWRGRGGRRGQGRAPRDTGNELDAFK